MRRSERSESTATGEEAGNTRTGLRRALSAPGVLVTVQPVFRVTRSRFQANEPALDVLASDIAVYAVGCEDNRRVVADYFDRFLVGAAALLKVRRLPGLLYQLFNAGVLVGEEVEAAAFLKRAGQELFGIDAARECQLVGVR